MAIAVQGPVACVRRGRVAGQVFGRAPEGMPYVRVRQYQPDVTQNRSIIQMARRAAFVVLSVIWSTLDAPGKAYWDLDPGRRQARNIFMGYNLSGLFHGIAPQTVKNAEHLDAPAAPAATAASVVDNTIVVTWTAAALATGTGIFIGTSAGFTAACSNLAFGTPEDGAEDRSCTLVDLPSGTYYIQAKSWGADGGWGADLAAAVGPFVIV